MKRLFFALMIIAAAIACTEETPTLQNEEEGLKTGEVKDAGTLEEVDYTDSIPVVLPDTTINPDSTDTDPIIIENPVLLDSSTTIFNIGTWYLSIGDSLRQMFYLTPILEGLELAIDQDVSLVCGDSLQFIKVFDESANIPTHCCWESAEMVVLSLLQQNYCDGNTEINTNDIGYIAVRIFAGLDYKYGWVSFRVSEGNEIYIEDIYIDGFEY